jgi:hypothetical protein
MNKYVISPPVPWLVASATRSMHPARAVRVNLSTPERRIEVMLSLQETEAAIRQLMQAYTDTINKSLTLCAYPGWPDEVREPLPLTTTGDPKKEKDARETLDRVRAVCDRAAHLLDVRVP